MYQLSCASVLRIAVHTPTQLEQVSSYPLIYKVLEDFCVSKGGILGVIDCFMC